MYIARISAEGKSSGNSTPDPARVASVKATTIEACFLAGEAGVYGLISDLIITKLSGCGTIQLLVVWMT